MQVREEWLPAPLAALQNPAYRPTLLRCLPVAVCARPRCQSSARGVIRPPAMPEFRPRPDLRLAVSYARSARGARNRPAALALK